MISLCLCEACGPCEARAARDAVVQDALDSGKKVSFSRRRLEDDGWSEAIIVKVLAASTAKVA